MTIILIGHDFKYEIEAVCKLFFPVQSFTFLMGDKASDFTNVTGDRCVLEKTEDSQTANLSAFAAIGGKEITHCKAISLDGADFRHDCEFGLCSLLFDCLSELTGIKSEWGMLTGVRPVKLVSRLKASGMTREQLYSHMQGVLRLDRSKIDLAYDTSENQRRCIEGLPPRSVSLYVSIPFCPSRCSYCSFVSQTVESFLRLIPDYVEALCREISQTARIVKGLGLTLDTVYFGGGTPTALSADELERIMRTISAEFDLSELREYTVEAGRPDTVTAEKMRVIRENGGDRVSVNPQTLRQSVLDGIGRRHTVGQFFEAYRIAKETGFKAVNVDLIAGLPNDDFEGFCGTLEQIIALDPENITVHALSIKRAADLMQESELRLSAAETSKMIAHSNATLYAAGYSPYYLYRQKNQLGNQENVGWQRGDNVGVYNVNMMEEIQTVLAVGAGGSTKIVADEQHITRLYNPKYPLEYLKRFEDTVVTRKVEAEEALRRVLEN